VDECKPLMCGIVLQDFTMPLPLRFSIPIQIMNHFLLHLILFGGVHLYIRYSNW